MSKRFHVTATARFSSRGNQTKNYNQIINTMTTRTIKPGPKRIATSTGTPDQRQLDNKKNNE